MVQHRTCIENRPAHLASRLRTASRYATLILIALASGIAISPRPVVAASISLLDGVHFDDYNGPSGSDPPVAGDTVMSVGTFIPFDPSLGSLTSVTFEIAATGAAYLTLSDLPPGDYTTRLAAYQSFGQLGQPPLWSSGIIALGGNLTATVFADGSVGQNLDTANPFEVEFADGNGMGFQYPEIAEGLDLFAEETQFAAATHYFWTVLWPDGDQTVVPATMSSGGVAVGITGGVTYTCVAIPEPTSVVLLGLGAALLSTIRTSTPRINS